MCSFLKRAKMLSNLWNSIKSSVSGVWKSLKDRGSSLLTGTKYVGPFNSLTDEYIRNNPPVDKVDEGAMFHDLDYARIARERDAGKISRKEATDMIRDSDKRFLSNTAKNFKENPWAGALGYAGIWGKTKLEDLGLVDPHKFVTAKMGLFVSGDSSPHQRIMPVNRGKYGFGQERVSPLM